MRYIASDMIERVRECIQVLQKYLGEATYDYGNEPLISFSLLPNMSLEERAIPRLQGVALWLIHVEEIFLYDNFTSAISTYLYGDKLRGNTTSRPTMFD